MTFDEWWIQEGKALKAWNATPKEIAEAAWNKRRTSYIQDITSQEDSIDPTTCPCPHAECSCEYLGENNECGWEEE